MNLLKWREEYRAGRVKPKPTPSRRYLHARPRKERSEERSERRAELSPGLADCYAHLRSINN